MQFVCSFFGTGINVQWIKCNGSFWASLIVITGGPNNDFIDYRVFRYVEIKPRKRAYFYLGWGVFWW